LGSVRAKALSKHVGEIDPMMKNRRRVTKKKAENNDTCVKIFYPLEKHFVMKKLV